MQIPTDWRVRLRRYRIDQAIQWALREGWEREWAVFGSGQMAMFRWDENQRANENARRGLAGI